jgi:VCBS repeat-containing protein
VAAQDDSATATDTTTHDVTVTVHGSNDAAVFGGDEAGDTTEDGGALQATGGTLTVSDADHDQSAFASTSDLAGSYGDFTFDTGSGDWTFTLRNGDANVQALAEGQQVTDTLTVTSTDGSTQDITVTVTGADEPNQPPVATDDHWIISQNTTASFSIAALLGNDSDPDGNPLSVTALSTNGVTWVTDASDGTADGVIHLTTGSLAVNTVNGTISYAEPSGATGNTTFFYQIDDANGGNDLGQVTVTAQPVGNGNTADTINLSSAIYDYSYINSGNGTDSVSGGTAVDTFLGGSGNDTITGGPGNDQLTGDSGSDHFVYKTPSEGFDTILDFSPGGGPNGDILDFSAISFGGGLATGGANTGTLDASHFTSNATGTASAATAQFVYNTSTGVLAFDSDGTGATAAIQLAIVENGGNPVGLTNTDVHLI